ncbi:hypothetical protein VSR82_00090 [Burkholderia sp. JPY481]
MKVKQLSHVRERDFEIGIEGTPTQVMKTGWLNSCIAFYGVDAKKGRSFLCHMDLLGRGFDCIIDTVAAHSKQDLSGYDLYVTSGLNRFERAGYVFLWTAVFWKWFGPVGRTVTVVGLAAWLFGPMAYGYWRLRHRFGHCPTAKFRWGFGLRRVEVTVDASTSVQQEPRFESEWPCKTKPKFKPRKGVWWCSKMERASEPVAVTDASVQSRETEDQSVR